MNTTSRALRSPFEGLGEMSLWRQSSTLASTGSCACPSLWLLRLG